MKEIFITKQYLQQHPNEIFVFGDNLIRKGVGGAAVLRYEPNVYGFVTKKKPTHDNSSYYMAKEYLPVYQAEIKKLVEEIKLHPDKTYLISKLGAGLANRFGIFEHVIESNIRKDLDGLPNVKFLW